MDFNLQPRKVTQFLFWLTIGFVFAQIAGLLAEIHLGLSFGLSLFDIDGVQSIPKFYSAVMLLLISGLLLTIALAKKRDDTRSFLYWLGLAFIFFIFAINKSSGIHEVLAGPIRAALNLSKIRFYAWVYGIVVVIFITVYLKFILGLPRGTILLLAIGGFTFFAGTFGLDLAVAYLGKSLNHYSVVYIGLATFEGLLEMVGVVILVYALLLYMSSELKWIRVRISDRGR